MKRPIVFAVMCAGLVFAAVGPAGVQAEAEEHEPTVSVSPEICPIMDRPIDKSFFVDYKGKRVYLCCKVCVSAFKETPEKYLSKFPQFSAAAAAHSDVSTEEQGRYAHLHDADQDAPRGLRRLVRFAGQFHPMASHFPIALVMAAALAELLAWSTKSNFFKVASRFNIIVAAIGAVVTVLLGFASAAFGSYPNERLEIHEWFGICAGVLIIVSAVLCEVSYRRDGNALLFRIALGVSVVLIGLTGYFGANLVYGPGHYTW